MTSFVGTHAFLDNNGTLFRSVTSVDKLRTFKMNAKPKTVRARKAMHRALADILLKITTVRVTTAPVVISTLDVAVKFG